MLLQIQQRFFTIGRGNKTVPIGLALHTEPITDIYKI